MWEMEFFELFTTIIPQSFAIILLFFSFVGIKIKVNSFVLFSFLIAVVLFVLKPYVNFGVHSTITMFLLVIISVLWGKKNILNSVIFSVITFGIAFLCEMVVFVYLGLINFDMQMLENDPYARAIIGIIPLFLLFSIAIIVANINKKNLKKKEVTVNAHIRDDIE